MTKKPAIIVAIATKDADVLGAEFVTVDKLILFFKEAIACINALLDLLEGEDITSL